MRALNSQTLHGLWSAIPTPFDASGQLDPAVLVENCQRLKAARVDGIYTTDSDGEFYAIDLDEFRRLAVAFGKAVEAAHVDAAMGVTWTNTQGVVDRLRAACDAGVPNVHVAFPYFMPLAQPDVDRFFEDLAVAVPRGRWIYYAHPQCQPTLTGRDLHRIAQRFPEQMIGTKVAAAGIAELTEIVLRSHELSHGVGDTNLVFGLQIGARACCSYWVNTLPGWTRRYYDLCLKRDYASAIEMHRKLMRWELDHVAKLRVPGHRHGILGKARSALSGFLIDSGYTRAPYYPVSEALRGQLQSEFNAFWREEIATDAGLAHVRK